MKIGTLLPSATEIVCVLGLEKTLVGISHECDFPTSITHLPRLTSSSIGKHRNSEDIHRSVETLLKNSISVYDLDLELLRSLKPDYLITQDLCDVCAVSFSQVKDACAEVLGRDTKIISLRPQRLKGVWEDVRNVAQELGVIPAYEEFKQDVDRRIEYIRNKLAENPSAKRSVLTIEWYDPVMIGGLWVPEMIELAGGCYLLAAPGERALTVTRKNLTDINPDVVIVKPCGFGLDQTLQELETLKRNVPLANWRAYQDNNIFIVDGNAYFNRPGPRILDSLEILSYCLHPEIFPEFLEKYGQALLRLEPGLEIPAQ
ncbi:MAG: ABC transporter substrate-binding protein [Nitrospinae bacterium]|nr:ABC transporter substrate-binding protein [Nitrospinota bacterium]